MRKSPRWPAVLVKHPDTWMVTDDIYNSMVFDGIGYHNFVHAQPELRDRLVFVDSVSKTYGMPGWRVGLIAGPEVVAKAVTTLNSNHITSLPEVITAAAVAALSGPQDVPEPDARSLPASATPCSPRSARFPAWSARGRRARSMRSLIFPWRSARATRHEASTTTSSFAPRCWRPRASPAYPVRRSASRVRMRISYTCPTAQLQPGLQRIAEFFAELV